MGIVNTILDIIFPTKCLICNDKGADLCLNCLLASPEAERESAKWIFPMYDYRHPPIKRAIWLLKYKGKRNLAGIFAEAMHARILEELADLDRLENFRNPILVPIPLAPGRRRERGFNQAALICDKLSKLNLDLELLKKVLIKPKDTEHQARIEDRRRRLQNIVGCFRVSDPTKIKNRNIILIDDVTTTGATLSEAKKVLREAGARKVIAFAIAH